MVPADYDETGLTMPQRRPRRAPGPVTAEYVVRAILGGERPAGSEPVEVGFFVDDREQGVLALDPEGLGSFSRDRQDFTGKTREFRVRLTAGEHWLSGTIVRLFEGLPASYGGPNPRSGRAAAARVQAAADATPERMAEARETLREAAHGDGAGQRRAGGAARGDRAVRAGAAPRREPARRSTRAVHAGRRHDPGGRAQILTRARAPRLPAAGDRRGRGPARAHS